MVQFSIVTTLLAASLVVSAPAPTVENKFVERARYLVKRATDLKNSVVTFQQPAQRSWNDDTDTRSPCGGAPYTGERTSMPFTNAKIAFVVRADASMLEFNYATVENPSKNGDFKALVHQRNDVAYRGHYCQESLDFASQGLSVGQNITIQAKWRSGDKQTTLYSCADVTLVQEADFVGYGEMGCFTATVDGPTIDTNDYTDPSGGISKGAKLGVGLGVGLGGALLLAVLAFFGYKKFGNKNKIPGVVGGKSVAVDEKTLSGESVAELRAKASV